LKRYALTGALGVLLCVTALFLPGCANIGPATIGRDRFDYVNSISDSWKRQMLLNLLKVRYADAPVFLEVASVINSYSLEGNINLSGQYAPIDRGDTFANVGVTGKYADTPTITYAPLGGDRFARSLMTPLPVTGILYLIQSGYPADLVLRVSANTINGLENAFGGVGNPRAGNPRFFELLAEMRSSQAAGGMGMRIKQVGDAQAVIMFLRPDIDEALAAPNRKIRELLGLKPDALELTVVYGAHQSSDTEVAILSRSMLQIMADFASYIEVPPSDVAEGRVYVPFRGTEEAGMVPPLIRIHQGDAPPQDAFVSTRYRDHWFWIDDRDVRSKSLFSFLMFMFALTETGETQTRAPVVTVPAR
jgi:hypothetical protein